MVAKNDFEIETVRNLILQFYWTLLFCRLSDAYAWTIQRLHFSWASYLQAWVIILSLELVTLYFSFATQLDHFRPCCKNLMIKIAKKTIRWFDLVYFIPFRLNRNCLKPGRVLDKAHSLINLVLDSCMIHNLHEESIFLICSFHFLQLSKNNRPDK